MFIVGHAWSNDGTGRFQVELPWKINPKTLDNNREQAMNRDFNLRKQLSKSAMIYELFQEQIKDMVKNGIIYKVPYRGKFRRGKFSSGKIFVGDNFRHLKKISSLFPDEIFTR